MFLDVRGVRIKVGVVKSHLGRCKLGFIAPDEVMIFREEVEETSLT